MFPTHAQLENFAYEALMESKANREVILAQGVIELLRLPEDMAKTARIEALESIIHDWTRLADTLSFKIWSIKEPGDYRFMFFRNERGSLAFKLERTR